MKVALRARTVYQKVTLATTAFVLAIASLTASVPFILFQNASAVSSVVYEGVPASGSAAYASLGYEATSTNEFGDLVQLSGSNRLLSEVTVNFTSWACQTGSWNTNDCVSADGATFTHPVTVNIYKAGSGNTLGALLATKTQTITAKYRPSSDATHCTGADAGKWYDAASSTCYNGISFNQSFDFSSLNKVVPDQIVVGVAYNTKDHGYTPTGVASPADSLNVSLPTSGPTTGTDVDSDSVFWSTSYAGNYSDGGAAGTGFRADTGWSPYHVGINVSANPVPTTSTCSTVPVQWSTNLTAWNSTPGLDDTRSAGHNVITDDGIHVYTDDATSNAKATGYLPVNYPLSGNGSQTIAQSMDWTQNSGTIAPGLQLVVDFNNDGTPDGTLVGESVYGNNWWLTNGSQQFVKDAAPQTGGGNGSNWFGTINDWLTSFPAAQVKYVGYSLGSGVHADGLLKSMTFGCTQYKFDGVAPATPVHSSPANNAYLTTNDFYFKWNAVPGADHYEIQNSTNPAVAANGSFQNVMWTGDYQHIQPTLPQAHSVGASGTWYWQVRAVDAAGNTSAWTTPWKVTIDTTAPSLTLSSPTTGEVYGGLETHPLQKKTITVSASASDASGLGAYCVKITKVGAAEGSCVSGGYFNSPANGTLPSVTINTTTLTSGQYVVKARITDKAGNATEQTATIAVDNTKPVLSTPITNGQVLTNTTSVTLNADEAHPNIYNIRVLDSSNTVVAGLYDANASSTSETLSWNTRTVPNGTYTIQFSARDAVGNSATTIYRTVTVDNDYTAPSVGIDDASVTTDTPNIFGSIDDPTAIVTLSIDGTPVTATNNGDSTWSYQVNTPLSDGPHALSVYATDSSGNSSTPKTATLTVATTPAPGGGTNTPASGDGSPSTDGTTPTTTPASTTTPNGGLPFAVFGTPQVLGDSTNNTSNTDPTGASDVKGTSTQKTLASALPDSSNGSVWGLAWYWWLLILAAIATIIWWIISAIRNRANAN